MYLHVAKAKRVKDCGSRAVVARLHPLRPIFYIYCEGFGSRATKRFSLFHLYWIGKLNLE